MTALRTALAAATLIASAVAASAQTHSVGSCRVQLRPPWTATAKGAVAPGGSTIRIVAVPNEKMVIDFLGEDFVRLEESPTLLVFGRDLPNSGRQLRSVTRTRPGCAADVDARTSAAASAAMAIARSIARTE
jgi:hypothetical protein